MDHSRKIEVDAREAVSRTRLAIPGGFPVKRLWLPGLLVLALSAAWLAGLGEHLTLSAFIRQRQLLAGLVEANFLTALLAYMALYAALVAISFPGASLLTLASGFLFGGLTAGLATVMAATAGAVLIFLVARSSFGSLFERKAGGFVARLAHGFREDAFLYLLSLRLTPLFPFWVVNIVPGMLNMALLPYVLATFIGIIPGTFAFAYVGSGLGSVIAAQEAVDPGCADAGTCAIDPAGLLTPQLILAMAGLGVVSLIAAFSRRFLASDRRTD